MANVMGDTSRMLQPGTPVEVRSRFDQSWSSGFEVAETLGTGYHLRRLSDGVVLPMEFPDDDVRLTKS